MSIQNALKLFASLALLFAVVFGFLNFEKISDFIRLRNYTPSARIIKIADDTTMTADTRRLFYVNHPELSDKASFNGQCRLDDEPSIVLGCYVTNRGIYVLDVKDKRLAGIIEVTSAHEVLHSAYDRLSSKEKIKVDKMTNDFFTNLKDTRIRETIDNYRKKDSTVVPNELHSILATEVRDLSPDLEAYYSRYFSDRKKIAEYSEQYEATFLELRSRVDDYDAQLETLKKQIAAAQTNIDALNGALESDRAELDSLLDRKEIEAYNRSIPAFNSKVAEYNRLINETRQLINNYNSLVQKRNELATEEQELVEAIDSNQLTEKKRN